MKMTADVFNEIQELNRDGEYGSHAHDVIETLLEAIQAQGGPVCVDCKVNQARYRNGRCSLCDMQLPPEERGERL